MSEDAGTSPRGPRPVLAEVGTPRGAWAAVDRLLAHASDWLNPILVKETRQALKSRQFVVTFGLLLIVAWGWSMLGVAMMGPEASYGVQRGSYLFVGYYVILALPLLVIVPYGAFRSLAAEQEDRTFELMSITTLDPRQIVSGKLGSAVLQMLIYLSAVAPCIAFTYMLRGIALPTIFFLLFYTFLGSLGLSLAGLLVGTLTDEKHWQSVLSVLVVLGLLIAFWSACALAVEVVDYSDFGVTEREFWIANAAFLSAYVSYFALVYFAAAAQLSFPSDNRSTRLRVTMLGQFLLFVGWMSWVWVTDGPDEDMLTFFLVVVGLHWYGMGALMTGESAQLSYRVRRSLPQSFLGRAFLTWFNPGPGTGYVFALCGMLAGLLLVCLALASAHVLPNPRRPFATGRATDVLTFGTLAFCYMTIFLGLGLVLIRLTRRFSRAGLGLSVLVQVMLVLLGCGVPLVIQLSSPRWYGSGYSLLQITNVFWTLYAASETRAGFVYGPVLLAVLPLAALAVFVLNLPAIVREVRFVRLPKPQRVAEEDAQQAAVLRPPQPVQISPWDVQEPGK